MAALPVVGIDAAFANMGLARAALTSAPGGAVQVECVGLKLVTTELRDKKTVRKSSDDLRRGRILYDGMTEYINAAPTAFVFAEVPSGSQSAVSARGLGIAVGVLAACPIIIVEVSPMEVKRLFTDQKRSVPKAEIMEWAYAKWPDAPWLTYGKKNPRRINDNEHLADAMATIQAGVKTPEFKQLMAMHHATTSARDDRPAPDRSPGHRIQVRPVPMDQRTRVRVRR